MNAGMTVPQPNTLRTDRRSPHHAKPFRARGRFGIAMVLLTATIAACSAAPETASPTGTTSIAADPQELIGTWEVDFPEDLDATTLAEESGIDFETVTVRIGFEGKQWWQGFAFDGEVWLIEGIPEGDGGTYTVTGDEVTLIGNHGESSGTYKWRTDGEVLTMRMIKECFRETRTCITDHAELDPVALDLTERPFLRIADDAAY